MESNVVAKNCAAVNSTAETQSGCVYSPMVNRNLKQPVKLSRHQAGPGNAGLPEVMTTRGPMPSARQPDKNNRTTRRHVPFLCQQHRGAESCASPSAAVRRCGRLPLLRACRQHAASGLRLVLADQDRTMDPRSRRYAVHGRLFLHADGRAVDFNVVAVAGAVRSLLCAM